MNKNKVIYKPHIDIHIGLLYINNYKQIEQINHLIDIHTSIELALNRIDYMDFNNERIDSNSKKVKFIDE